MENLFEIVKQDRVDEFTKFAEEKKCFNVAFGRFPILCVCYLYNCKKILKKYEKDLLKVNNFEVFNEPIELFKDLLSKVKKEARIYVAKEDIISPIEMLYMLGYIEKAQSLYELNPKDDVLNKISKIEKIRSYKDVKKEGKSFTTIKPKLSRAKKKLLFIASAVFALFICIAICFSGLIYSIGIGTSQSPLKVSNQEQLNLYIQKDVSTIILNKDIYLTPTKFKDYAGVIDGNGYSIIVENIKSPIFDEFYGTIKNVKFIFNIDTTLTTDAFVGICNKNLGNINNVEIIAHANIEVKDSMQEADLTFGIKENSGDINNVKVSGDIDIKGVDKCNTLFAPVCIDNKNTISNVEYNANINATECDIAGVCIKNSFNSVIKESTIQGQLTQSASSNAWSPNVGGVCLENYGTIEDVISNSSIKATSSADSLYQEGGYPVAIIMGGIVANNYSIVQRCRTLGDLYAECNLGRMFIGGVSGLDFTVTTIEENKAVRSYVTKCVIDATLQVKTQNKKAVIAVGGISGGEESIVSLCCVNLDITQDIVELTEGTLVIGGICGSITNTIFMEQAYFNNYYLYNNHFVAKDNISRSVGQVSNENFAGTKHSSLDEMKKVEEYWE